ncbi:MAG: STAS domain-containing protein [Pirellulaceae bacterium]
MLGVQNIGSVSVIKARSSLVGECVDHCRQAVMDALGQRRNNLVLDLAESPIVNSQGLEFIVDAQEECLGRGGKLVILDPTPVCSEVLEITGIADYVAVFSDLRAALSDFAK